jgi:hypothetical protein
MMEYATLTAGRESYPNSVMNPAEIDSAKKKRHEPNPCLFQKT